MASCAVCGTFILFGGHRDEQDQRYCGDDCWARGQVLAVAGHLDQGVVRLEAEKLHSGRCPVCSGPGPVDVFSSHRVYSVLLMTSHSSRSRVSCRRCAVKAHVGDSVFSFFLGWWGVPWGLIMTPVQIGKNLVGILRGRDLSRPSSELEGHVRYALAESVLASPPEDDHLR